MDHYLSKTYIERGAVLHIFSYEATGTMGTHDHDFLELVYILDGRAEERVGDATYTVARGDLLLIREGETHSFEGTPSFSYVNLCIDPAHLGRGRATPSVGATLLGRVALDDILEKNGGCLIRFSEGERAEIEPLLSMMQKEYLARRHGWQTVIGYYLDIFFLSVRRALEERGQIATSEGLWDSLAAYITAHPTADLSLTALSRRLFYNPSYLSRAFSHHFGTSLSYYFSAVRVDEVERLCKATPDSTVNALAEAAGFASKSALYRAFLRHRGTPFGTFLAECKKMNR